LFIIRLPMKNWTAELKTSTPNDTLSKHQAAHMHWPDWVFGLAGYGLFGVGYIGYMTFVVALLREQGASASDITLFYAMLGLAVVASSRVWAGLLNRYRGGQSLAILNALLSLATLIPAISSSWPMMLVSGVFFVGGCLHHGHGETQPGAFTVGGGHQYFHGDLCRRANHWTHYGGLDCRWPRRASAWPYFLCSSFVDGGSVGLAAKPCPAKLKVLQTS
jgi:hypothetical protein